MLGIKYPIVQGGMQWVGTAELASAISNAGGLGMLSALTQPTPEDLRGEIRRCQSLTKHPFGVNLTILPSINPIPYEDYAKVIIEEGIQVVETAGNNPQQWVNLFKQNSIKVIHKCTSIRHAIKAEKLGVDVVSVDGFECAGHPGEDDVTGLILLPRAKRVLNIPFLASGGLGTGSGLAAALSLGADGINMGTRFMCTKESQIHQSVKEYMVQAKETDTILIMRSLRNSARVFKNKVASDVVAIEKKHSSEVPMEFSKIQDLVSGKRGKEVYTIGDIDRGIWTAGQVVGLIEDIPSCDELITRIISEAVAIIQSLPNLIVPPSKL